MMRRHCYTIAASKVNKVLAALPAEDARPLCALAASGANLGAILRATAQRLWRARADRRGLLAQGWIQGTSDALARFRALRAEGLSADAAYQQAMSELLDEITHHT
jgi:hypothetical protein